MDLMKNKSLVEALIAENSFTLIMSVIYSYVILPSNMHINRESGKNQLLYLRRDICDQQL